MRGLRLRERRDGTECVPVTPYQRGFEDARRMAVEKVRSLGACAPGCYAVSDVLAAILAIEPPGEETHEERWRAQGYDVKWNDLHRKYEVKWVEETTALSSVDRSYCSKLLPTVQAVDEWIAERGKETKP